LFESPTAAGDDDALTHAGAGGARCVVLRRTPTTPLATSPPPQWVQPDPGAPCMALLLTRTCSEPSTGAVLLLRTLLQQLLPGAPDTLTPAVLGDARTWRTTRGDAGLCAAVTVSVDGVAIPVDELSRSWPPRRRDLLRDACTRQLLWALAHVLDARWLGGFHLLLGAARTTLLARATPNDVVALEAAACALARRAPGGGPGAEAPHAALRHGEALEAAGRYAEAAAVYKECLLDDARACGPGGDGAARLNAPALVWSYVGIALRRAGDYAGAFWAYERGLSVLASPDARVVPDTPAYREGLRLLLLSSLYAACSTAPDARAPAGRARTRAMLERVWGAERAVPGARFGMGFNALWLEQPDGRRFAVTTLPPSSAAQEEEGPCGEVARRRIVELPRGAAVPTLTDARASADAAAASVRALDVAGATALFAAANAARARAVVRDAGVALPRLLGVCAVCGAPGSRLKRCAACMTVEHCSPACQKQGWRAHKNDCRAAAAAAAATEAAQD
jgi:hypothetical protein